MRLRLLALAAGIALAACVTAPAPQAPLAVRLIAFNDFHGNLEAAPNLTLPWPDPAQRDRIARLNAGGAAALAGTVQALRAGAKHSLVLSSGDLIGATPLVSALFHHESTVDVINRVGVDLAIPGNHEFDAGRDELLRVMGGGCRESKPGAVAQSCALERHAGARFPHFAANVLTADGKPLFAPSVVREIDGVRIGFIGAVTKITPSIVVPSGVAGLRFTDEADAINAEAARLKAQGIQALVAVIHEGGDTGTPGLPMEWNDVGCPNPRGAIFDIARRTTQDVDLIFSAHTHQGYRCVVDGRPIMQATALGRGVSVADVVIDRATGEVDRARTVHRNLPVFNERSDAKLREAIIAAEPAAYAEALRNAKPVAAVAARVAQYAAAAAPLAQRPVGRIGGNFDRSSATDASAGRLIADAQWLATRAAERGGAQFALMNPGGVRTDLRCAGGPPPCTITYGEAFAMQPFGNNLVVMTLGGEQLKQLLEDQQRPGRAAALWLIPSASLTYRWHASAPHGQRVQQLRIGDQPWSATANYRFTVNSFLAEGGDGISMLTRGRDRLGGELDLDALISHLAGTPSPDPVPRITLVP
ncbi:MAG TPA: bifunctional metallophosphatase/5'-nucleotidase [Burkholderiaceae bacterium]|nr:bifunctional metallophosphatase/5'-nucleotidase [Burkholderiaceae bacterium]